MKKTLRLLAAACVLTASIGCQPADNPDVSTDIPVEMGESNLTATGETPDSSVTGQFETPAAEVPAEPAAVEAPAEPAAVEAPAEPAAVEAPAAADAPFVEEKPAD